jgi:hypothetical protein
MADRINAYKVTCVGGLNTHKDVLSQGELEPGSAYQMINYEPSITGGYRRISGYTNSYGTVPGTGNVLGVAVIDKLNDGIFACRAPTGASTAYFYRWNDTTDVWNTVSTPITVTMTGVVKVRFTPFNWGAPRVALTDGINPAAIYNGTTYTQITDANAPNSPKYAATFKNHLFLAGDPSDAHNLYISAPLAESDFNPANGAGVINVGFDIVQIKQFRDTLFIFGKNAIKSLTGSNIADFVLNEVTSNLGCIVPDSVIEIGGSLLFLGPDGFRPVAGTAKIGDVELETVSKKIQATINAIYNEYQSVGANVESLSSVVLRKKSQFRFFIPNAGSFGIIGGLRETANGIGFEYGQLFGVYATCAASSYLGNDEVVIHGDSAGKVQKQESGTSFGGDPILSVYQTPYYYFEDPTVRKNFYRITTFLRSEGTINIALSVSYDFDDTVGVFNPANYTLTNEGSAAYYNEALYDAAAIYDGNPSPVLKTNISGSGFSVAYKYVTNDTNASHTIQGLVVNYAFNDRR